MLKSYATAASLCLAFLLSVTPNVNSKSLEASPKNSKPAVVGPVTDGYRLTATTNKKAYNFGESIGLVLTLRNMTKTKVNVGFGADLSDFQVDIWGPDGKKAGYTTYGYEVFDAIQGGSHFVDTLSQGDERSIKVEISRYYEMSAAGRYKIAASRSFSNREEPEQSVTVTSNSVTVLVKPKST